MCLFFNFGRLRWFFSSQLLLYQLEAVASVQLSSHSIFLLNTRPVPDLAFVVMNVKLVGVLTDISSSF